MTPKLVADASLVLKWQFDDEEYVIQALRLRDNLLEGRVEVLAPALLPNEVANGLVVALRRGRISSERAHLFLVALFAFGVQMHTPDLKLAFNLASSLCLTAYDGAYLALAGQEGCEFWTADRALFKAVSPRLPWVHWIGDYA